MRDIKFRAWNSIDKAMVDNTPVMINLKRLMISKHYYVMQFTGLYDGDGNEIYEGDICQISGSGNLQAIICPINGVCFGDQAVTARDCVMEMESVSVVGNIYENPELLKGE